MLYLTQNFYTTSSFDGCDKYDTRKRISGYLVKVHLISWILKSTHGGIEILEPVATTRMDWNKNGWISQMRSPPSTILLIYVQWPEKEVVSSRLGWGQEARILDRDHHRWPEACPSWPVTTLTIWSCPNRSLNLSSIHLDSSFAQFSKLS